MPTSACVIHPPFLVLGELCALVITSLLWDCVLLLAENPLHTYKGSGAWLPFFPYWQGLL